jgi:hypothetical protein
MGHEPAAGQPSPELIPEEDHTRGTPADAGVFTFPPPGAANPVIGQHTGRGGAPRRLPDVVETNRRRTSRRGLTLPMRPGTDLAPTGSSANHAGLGRFCEQFSRAGRVAFNLPSQLPTQRQKLRDIVVTENDFIQASVDCDKGELLPSLTNNPHAAHAQLHQPRLPTILLYQQTGLLDNPEPSPAALMMCPVWSWREVDLRRFARHWRPADSRRCCNRPRPPFAGCPEVSNKLAGEANNCLP